MNTVEFSQIYAVLLSYVQLVESEGRIQRQFFQAEQSKRSQIELVCSEMSLNQNSCVEPARLSPNRRKGEKVSEAKDILGLD